MNKTVKWILIAVLVIVVIAIVIFFIQNSSNNQLPVGSGPGAAATIINAGAPSNAIQSILGGLFASDWIKNLFGGKNNMANPACQSSNPGFDNNGYYTRACGGVPGGGGSNCNPDAPGKDMNGFSSSQCGG